MMSLPVTLAHLRVFAAVAKHCSFSRAADELRVSQPYVSGQIAGLEARLALVLFNRTGRRAYLSEAGKLFLPYAAKVLTTLQEADRSLQDFRGLVTGHLVVAASSTPGAYLLPRLLGQFLEDYPGVHVTLQIKDTVHVERLLLSQEAELGVVASPPTSTELATEPLGLDELLLVVGPRHRWVNRSGVTFKDLEEERLLVRERTSGTRIRIDEELTRTRVQPRTMLELSTVEAIREALACGLGISFLSKHAVQQDIAARRLVVVMLAHRPLTRPISLLTSTGHKLSPAAAVFRNLILAEFTSADRT
ncbi:MAG: LysR family transcriptional regulator [Luteitalea sp.]|nr:LysR family transcriptional regulator [Luteitalea sp.]